MDCIHHPYRYCSIYFLCTVTQLQFLSNPPSHADDSEGACTLGRRYSMLIGTPIILYVGYKAKPNSSIEPWAIDKARAQLKAEGIEL